MKKILKFILRLFAILLLVVVVWGLVAHESLPQGKTGPEADALAKKMLTALNAEAYQNTRFLEWSFQGGKHRYQWDRLLGVCTVRMANVEVKLNFAYLEASLVKENGKKLTGEPAKEYIDKALANFNNDSFWLVAPYKIFDQGTTRSIVTMEDGSQGLMVTYAVGGTTPGDSYLWQLNPNGFPNAYKMWVKILPLGGVHATWDDWQVTESGAFLPKQHKMGPVTLFMGNVRGYGSMDVK